MSNNNNKSDAATSVEKGLEDSVSDTLSKGESGAESSFLAELGTLTKRGVLYAEDGKVAPRMFRFEDKMVFAFLLEEVGDSFLVAFPSTLKETLTGPMNKTVIAAQLMPTAICRLMKSSVSIVAFPVGTHLLSYLQSSTGWFQDLPGYFTPARVTQVQSLITFLNDKLNTESEVIEERDEFSEDDEPSTPDKLMLPQEFWPKQRH